MARDGLVTGQQQRMHQNHLVLKVSRHKILGGLDGVDATDAAAYAQLQIEHEVIAAVALVDGLPWASCIALALHTSQ